MAPPLEVEAPTVSNDKSANIAPNEASDESVVGSNIAAEVPHNSRKLHPSQNQNKPSGSATPRDDAGDMQAEIKRLSRQIQDLKMIHQEEREQLEDTWEEDYEFRSWSTREVKAPGMPFTRSHRAYVSEKIDKDFPEEADLVEAIHYARDVERQDVQAWRLAHPGQEYQDPQSKTSPPSTSMLNRVPWSAFQDSLEVTDQAERFAIDVLIGEPNVKVTLPSLRYRTGGAGRYGFDNRVDPSGGAANAPSVAANLRKPTGRTLSRGQGPLPERIRINSTAILRILSKIFQEEISTKFEPVLMMRPFRGLIWYKGEIRKWRDDLEKNVIKTQIEAEKTQEEEAQKEDESKKSDDKEEETMEDFVEAKVGVNSSTDQKEPGVAGKELEGEPKDKDPQSTVDDVSNNAPEEKGDNEKGEDKNEGEESERDERPPRRPRGSRRSRRGSIESMDTEVADAFINTQEALDDLNCLVEFVDHDLEDKLAYIASDDCTKVLWSDIWHLFKPGDFVVSKDEKQAYRVIQVKYSTHSMKPPTGRNLWMSEAKAKLEDSPITIQCVFLDFDGERIGPVTQTIDIHRYEGERSIRSLPVVPLRRAKTRSLKEILIKRGSLFIEACDPQRRGIPMHYSGLSLETQEEIDSQVVIDFEEAFATNDVGGKTKPSGWTIEKLVLECFAGSIKDEMQLYLHDVQTNWKPELKDIDPGGDSDTDYTSDSSDDRAGRRRRGQTNRTCLPQCCSDENVHDDVFVEHNRSSEFVQSQFWEDDMNEGMPSLTIAARSLREAMEDEEYITDDDKLITSYRVFGFIMRSRKWAKLDLTYLGPMKGQNTFDLLVLPPGHREMVESLVTQHFLDKASAYDETDEVDIVRGKGSAGKGLILLLHGAPGVGKTTTAECVATYFHKPLFQITCGDLGSTADVVESRLEKNFALASRWGCILLIDEADVFLEARQTENFDRNSLVAVPHITVFLRTLEYYTGILFLTTNRVGTFDEAFTSRIHISLYYPPLNLESTVAVFKVNLTRIKARFEKKKERGEAELELDEMSIATFIHRYFEKNKDARWNGRQIRNACQTALALAEFEGQKLANPAASGGRNVMEFAAMSKKMIKVKLAEKHFQDVAKAYLAFIKYLREVHGVSAAQQAKNYRLRHDRWGLGESASLLASRQREYGAEGKPEYGQRYGPRPSGRGDQQTRGPRYRQEQNVNDEDIAEEYGYTNEYHGYEDDQGLMQDDDDGRDFENGPSFDEEDDYDEGYEERPAARGKQPAQKYDEDNEYYPDDQQETPKYRPGPSQSERHTARGGNRGRGAGRSQQVSRRGDHVPKRRGMPGANRRIPHDEAD
ncbi:TOB3 (member of AAA-ATPase family) [Fusarium circinatum]|uniref:TOB3 (Member of AAA-ATPase family) n=1 Tax=Fusarium circinatum TaxID=48490 RepID=A0A8H5SVL8_FUSCI|nr:TOB3 (member of AAA-ATPase family) [Fusarium circinatum]